MFTTREYNNFLLVDNMLLVMIVYIGVTLLKLLYVSKKKKLQQIKKHKENLWGKSCILLALPFILERPSSLYYLPIPTFAFPAP